MHDPEFGLGMDTRVHLWHPCYAKVRETNHNDVDWVDIEFSRPLTLPNGARSTERVGVQVRREAARDLAQSLMEVFPELGDDIRRECEEICQSSATVEES